jgi:hypothetical protein
MAGLASPGRRPRGYIALAETASNLYGRPATFGRMNSWFLDYHQALEFRLLGITLLLALSVTFSALAYTVRNSCRRLLRHTANGLPSCRRQLP